MHGALTIVRVAIAAALMFAIPGLALAQGQGQGQGLDQRGVRTSMFETYVLPHQWLIFPHFSYTTDHNIDYTPADLGYGADTNAFQGPVPEYGSAALHRVWPDRLVGTRGGRVAHHRDIRQVVS